MRRNTFTLLVFFAFADFVQPTAPPRSSLCGVALHHQTARLLSVVERALSSSVQCSLTGNLRGSEGALAASGVATDGTPWIELDAVDGVSETRVVHELFHLQLKSRGFPRGFRVETAKNVDTELVRLAATDIISLLEHRLFFPKMRQMGFDPVREYRAEVEKYIRGAPTPKSVEEYPELQSIGYAHVALLLNDPVLTRQMEKWYIQNNWTDQLSRGRELSSYIRKSNPHTPGEEKASLPVCLQLVLGQNRVLAITPYAR
jgi:hypothetical protein